MPTPPVDRRAPLGWTRAHGIRHSNVIHHCICSDIWVQGREPGNRARTDPTRASTHSRFGAPALRNACGQLPRLPTIAARRARPARPPHQPGLSCLCFLLQVPQQPWLPTPALALSPPCFLWPAPAQLVRPACTPSKRSWDQCGSCVGSAPPIRKQKACRRGIMPSAMMFVCSDVAGVGHQSGGRATSHICA